MAEGRDSSLTKIGSDADFEITCTPCGEDNTREEAVKYCSECQEYLCATCTRHHQRRKATKSHKLLDKSDAKDASVVAMTAKCRYHPDRDIEMYCGTHDMVYCTKCIAKEHRNCSNMKDIDEISHSQTTQIEIKRLQDESMIVHKSLVARRKEKEENISSLEVQRREIQENIVSMGDKLKQHIDSLTAKASSNLSCKLTETKGDLESDENIITATIDDIDKSTNQLQAIPSMDVAHQFIYLKLVQTAIAEAGKLHEEMEAKGTQVLKLKENTNFSGSILAGMDVGQVVVLSENQKKSMPKEYKLKAMKDINVKMKNDTKLCYISGVCQLQDGTIILTDWTNTKIKRLDDNYNVRDHCNLDSYPRGICCTGQGEIAVKMYNNTVHFISVGTSMSKVREIAIEDSNYWGIVCVDKELWVSTGSGVNVYSTSGTLLKTIAKDHKGQNIFKGTAQYMALSEDTVIVADYSDGAVCLGKDGTVRKEVRDKRLSGSNGVCVSSDKTLFLSGYNSENVMYFSSDEKHHGELIATKGSTCIANPGSMLFDNKRNCIILTSLKHSDVIYILELSYCCTGQGEIAVKMYNNTTV